MRLFAFMEFNQDFIDLVNSISTENKLEIINAVIKITKLGRKATQKSIAHEVGGKWSHVGAFSAYLTKGCSFIIKKHTTTKPHHYTVDMKKYRKLRLLLDLFLDKS